MPRGYLVHELGELACPAPGKASASHLTSNGIQTGTSPDYHGHRLTGQSRGRSAESFGGHAFARACQPGPERVEAFSEGVRTAPCDYNAPEQQYGESFPAFVFRNFSPWWDSGDCLDSNYGTGGVGAAYETPCNGGPWQQWSFG